MTAESTIITCNRQSTLIVYNVRKHQQCEDIIHKQCGLHLHHSMIVTDNVTRQNRLSNNFHPDFIPLICHCLFQHPIVTHQH